MNISKKVAFGKIYAYLPESSPPIDFSKKELPDMQEEEWREFEHWHSERAKCMENIQTLKASLKNPTSLDKFAVELKVQPSTSSRQQVTSKVNKIIKANKSMIVYCSDRLNTLSDQLGFEASSYDVVKSLQQADKNVNAGWKRRCDSHLENIRSCKKTVNNITTIVPIGASGFIGTSEESSGQIDILMREENDDDLGDIVDSPFPFASMLLCPHSSPKVTRNDRFVRLG